MRLRPEFRENLDFQPTNDFDGFWGQQFRLGLRLRFRPGLSGYLQLQDVHAWSAERDDIIYEAAAGRVPAGKPSGSIPPATPAAPSVRK